MLFGSLIIAAMWGFLDLIILRRFGVSAAWWPALLLMAGLAWTQAILWTAFSIPGVRLNAFSVLFVALVAVPGLKGFYNLSDELVTCVVLAMLVLGWVATLRGLTRARSEPEPESRWWGRRSSTHQLDVGLSPKIFNSKATAQNWLEWKLAGCNLTYIVLMYAGYYAVFSSQFNYFVETMTSTKMLPTIAGLSDNSMVTFWILVFYWSLPPLMAAGFTQAGSCFPSNKLASESSPFYASLPVSDMEYAKLKHRAVIHSTLITWALILILTIVWLTVSGRYQLFVELRQHTWAHRGMLEVVLLLVGIIVLGIVLTWALLWTGRFFQLPGRRWISAVTVILSIVLVIGSAIYVHGVGTFTTDPLTQMGTTFQTAILGLLLLKLVLFGLTMRGLVKRDWFDLSKTLSVIAVWVVLTSICSWTLHVCIHDVSFWSWAMIIAVILPVNRLLAAPLALAWNRHR